MADGRFDPDANDRLRAVAQAVHESMLSTGVDPDEHDARHRILAVAPLATDAEVEAMVAMVHEQLHGLGPLEPILRDPSVTEIMINGPGPIWVERAGRLERLDQRIDPTTLRLVIDRIVGPLGLRLDRVVPFADARLADGTRAHVAVAPLALDGPYVTLRRFGGRGRTLVDFAEPQVVETLRRGVETRRNIVVSGATGSGKTSLLNALADEIEADERIITLEDAAELDLDRGHVVRLESRPANAEGIGEVTMRALVRNALRMRPDRLIVGEVRGPETFEMVQAMNTGHAGSMSTCHSNSALDTLDRLAAMMSMADVALPASLARGQIVSAIDWVVHVERGFGGARRVATIVDVGGGEGPPEPLVEGSALTSAGRAELAKRGR